VGTLANDIERVILSINNRLAAIATTGSHVCCPAKRFNGAMAVRKLRIGIVIGAIVIGLAVTVAAIALLVPLPLKDEGQRAVVQLMHDVSLAPETTIPALIELKRNDRFGFFLVSRSYRNCLAKTYESAKSNHDTVETACRSAPSPKCTKEIADEASRVEMSLYPMIALEDPEAFFDNDIVRLHMQKLP
jgi:hypothetical protein